MLAVCPNFTLMHYVSLYLVVLSGESATTVNHCCFNGILLVVVFHCTSSLLVDRPIVECRPIDCKLKSRIPGSRPT